MRLKCDILLSTSAFKFNFRRCTSGETGNILYVMTESYVAKEGIGRAVQIDPMEPKLTR